ncbi:hypothetical protein M758_6G002500 [Ceratodon purpureus]|nr:hypothetical protein M758_6G002500 [Ceratodon purpureus]
MEEGYRTYRRQAPSLMPRNRKVVWDRDEIGEAGTSCECVPVKMHPKLWSKLPQHIVDCIYARVPYVDFFRLRCVCRRWNALLHSPSFLEENPSAPFPEPWFLVITKQFVRYLIFDSKCKSWIWIRLPGFFRGTWTIGSHDGLLYAIRKENNVLKVGVFNPRTKIWKELPPLQKPDIHVHLHGMVKQHREAEDYKLVMVTNPDQSMRSVHSTTQVYDSTTDSWSLSAAKIPKGRNGLFCENTVCCNGALYAYNEQPNDPDDHEPSFDGLLTLDLENDTWSWVAGLFPCETPLFHVFGLNMSRPSLHHGLFSWQSRVYAAAKNMRNIGRISFSIWELQESHAWKEVNQMPWDHFNWLSDEQDYPNYGTGTVLVQHSSFQCRNLVLICGFLEEEDLPFKFVLYDLHKREWHRLDVPLLLGHAGCVDHSLDSTTTTTTTTTTTDSSPSEEDARSRSSSSSSTTSSTTDLSSDTDADTNADERRTISQPAAISQLHESESFDHDITQRPAAPHQ